MCITARETLIMIDWRSRATFVVALILFFGSGAVSLVYQTLWVSWWVYVFGGSSYAIATVLAAFMAGLGLGSWLLGRYADRDFDRLAGYGVLEIAIGIYALMIGGLEWNGQLLGRDVVSGGLAIPKATEWVQTLYAGVYNRYPDHTALLVAVRFALSLAILLPVTTMMGATLPMLSRHLVGRISGVGAGVGRLYSWNTYGAVAGTLAGGFVLIEHLGRSATNRYMVAANLAIGAAALLWSAAFAESPAAAATKTQTPTADPPHGATDTHPTDAPGLPHSQGQVGDDPAGDDPANPALSALALTGLLIAFGISGAMAMVYEVAWSRLTGLVLGSSTYSFTVMLATFLTGIAAGSALAGRWLAGRQVSLLSFAVVQLGVGLGTAAVVFGGEALPALWLWLLPWREMVNPDYPTLTYVHAQAVGVVVCMAMMIVPALFLGAAFPVVVQIYSRQISRLGRSIGVVYASNTAGAIVGSVLGGFVMLPLLGLYQTMAVGCVVNCALAGALGLARLWQVSCTPGGPTDTPTPGSVPGRPSPGPNRSLAALAASVVVLVSVGLGYTVARAPAWDALLMNFGVFQYGDSAERDLVTAHGLRGFWRGVSDLKDRLASRYQLLYARDGLNSTVTVMCSPQAVRAKVLRQMADWPEPAIEALRERLIELAGQLAQDQIEGLSDQAAAVRRRQLAAEIAALRDATPGQLGAGLVMLVRPVGALAVQADDLEASRIEVAVELRHRATNTVLVPTTVSGTLAELAVDRHLRNNGKVDASDVGDMTTQLIIAQLPLLAHPDPQSVCVIGLGSGTTVGAVERFAGVRKIHCVELEPAVREAARFYFAHRHADFAADPRFQLFEQDGRNHLALCGDTYDVIINEPSNPWIAGIANLFTREFYQHAKAKLRPGGLLVQWLQLYSTSWPDYLMVLRGLRAEFPHVYIFRVDPADTGDTMILASQEPLSFDVVRMQKLIDSPNHTGLRNDLRQWLIPDAMCLLHATYLLGDADVDALLERWAQEGEIYERLHTDDRPLLEYSAPRTLLMAGRTTEIVKRLWRSRGHRPAAAVDPTGPVRLTSQFTDWPAIKDFAAALEGADTSRLAADLFRVGRRYLDSSDYAEAQDALIDTLRLSPRSAAALFALAQAQEIRGSQGGAYQPWQSGEWLEAAARGDPDRWLFDPPDEHVITPEELRIMAERMMLRLPQSPWTYLLYASAVEAENPDAPPARARICRHRARELLARETFVAPPRGGVAAEKLTTALLADLVAPQASGLPWSETTETLAALARLHTADPDRADQAPEPAP